MKLTDENNCFACGEKNPIGLHLKFQWENDAYVTEFLPRKEHEGYCGIVHGGLVATVLDEVMARMLWKSGKNVVTVELKIRLNKVAQPGVKLCVRGWVVKETRRLIECAAEARTDEGTIVAEAKGKFLCLGDEK
jgi:uncharacterized protein (TIGR00369 family)